MNSAIQISFICLRKILSFTKTKYLVLFAQLLFAVFDSSFLCISRQVCLFLKRGAAQNDGDEDGQDPLSIAVQQANADIVTLYVNGLKHFRSSFGVKFRVDSSCCFFCFFQAATCKDER